MFIPHKCRHCKYLFISNKKSYINDGVFSKKLYCMRLEKEVNENVAEKCDFKTLVKEYDWSQFDDNN